MSCRLRVVSVLALLLAALGCEQKSESKSSGESPDASVVSSSREQGKVEQALANAVQAGAATPAGKSGPPADGVMEPSRADAEVRPGQPPKVTLGAEGAAPKTLLRASSGTVPRALTVELTIQGAAEQGGLPPIAVDLALESKKGKVPGTSAVVAKVREVRIPVPNVPKEFVSQLAGLKGAVVGFSLSSEGAGFDFSSSLPAGAKPELRDLLEAVSEGLSLLTVGVPNVPVGSGAVWMVASREASSGFGLISYRMVKVVSIADKTAELEFDARRYAVGRNVDPALLGPGAPPASLREFSAGAKAKLQIRTDSLLASAMDGSAALRGAIDAGDPPGPQGQSAQRMIQAGTGYRITASK
ncbi:MAG: hypothetical protein QM784_36160 [Polyangiaceae bacterium]